MSEGPGPVEVDRGRSPLRWRLGSMMIAVALAAAFCRWPLEALALSAAVGGPVAGGWLRRKRGDDAMFAGSVLGGVGSYIAMFVVVSMAFAVAGARSFNPARLPEILGHIVLAIGFFGVVGMLVGVIVGVVVQAGVAAVRERRRRRQAAPDGGRLANEDRSDP